MDGMRHPVGGLVALRSNGLLVLLGLLVLAGVVLVLRRGGRLAGPGARRFAGRVATVLGCQLLAVALLAAAVNDRFGFYTSWDDLLGTGQPVALTVTPPHPPGSGALQAGTGGAARAGRGARGAPTKVDRVYARPDPRAARLVPADVLGQRSRIKSRVMVLLPPQYDEPAFAHRRFPVSLVLAGYPGHLGALEGSLAVPQTVDALLHTGRMTPTVLVLVSPTVAPPRDTECTDVPNGPQVATYLAQDLPTWVASHFRVGPPGHWGVLGFSTGGFCAAKLALTYPWVFQAGVSLSGYLQAVTDATTGDLFGGSVTARQQNDPLWRVQHLPQPGVSLLLTASKQETTVYRQVEQLASSARAPLLVSTIIRPTGGHNAGVWRGELPLCLQWLSATLPPVL